MTRVLRTAVLAIGLLALLPLSAKAQRGFRTEGVADIGIEFSVYEKLSAIPMKFGVVSRTKARFEPQEDADFIHGRYGPERWGLEVLVFERTAGAVTGEDTSGLPDEIKKQLAQQNAKSFAAQMKAAAEDDGCKLLTEGKASKARGKTPAYDLWEWVVTRPASYGGKAIELQTYSIAAVYDLEGKDVVLVCELPVKKDDKPETKFLGYAKQMVTSLEVVEKADTSELDPEKDKYADTPEKQAALQAAKANIASLGNWDYITSEHYIILFSWNAQKPEERRDAWLFARTVSEKMEVIRSRFTEAYPPTEAHKFPYSVIRVCADYNEFSAYGNTPRGVVGWFSPGTKEVVIFYDKDRIFGAPEDAVEVSYHESWHQYSDAYFGDAELHRWFDEGLAEYFSQFRKRGSKWQRVVLDGRFRSIRDQINTGSFVPISEIIYWSLPVFYGGDGPAHYAQAYSMVDFILEGKRKMATTWNPAWDGIMKRYGDTILETKDEKKASDAAFEGVDMTEFTEAWQTWVKKHMDR